MILFTPSRLPRFRRTFDFIEKATIKKVTNVITLVTFSCAIRDGIILNLWSYLTLTAVGLGLLNLLRL